MMDDLAVALAWLHGDHDYEKQARPIIGRVLSSAGQVLRKGQRESMRADCQKLLTEIGEALKSGRLRIITTKGGQRIFVLDTTEAD